MRFSNAEADLLQSLLPFLVICLFRRIRKIADRHIDDDFIRVMSRWAFAESSGLKGGNEIFSGYGLRICCLLNPPLREEGGRECSALLPDTSIRNL